jgi:hypothetical protein
MFTVKVIGPVRAASAEGCVKKPAPIPVNKIKAVARRMSDIFFSFFFRD